MLARTTLASRAKTTACGLGREHLAMSCRHFIQRSQTVGRPIVGPILLVLRSASGGPWRLRPQAVVLASEARVVLGRNAPDVLRAKRATA